MASSSPAAIIPLSDLSGGIGVHAIAGGRSSATFSGRPGSSMPPVRQRMSDAFTPYSSDSMPRAASAAVTWYSGTPTSRPFRSSGAWMPRSVRM